LFCFRRNDRTVIAFVVQAKKLNQARDTLRPMDIVTYPPGLRKNVMQRSSPCCNKLFALTHREWKVSLPVAMQVSNLMTVDAKLDSAKAMREFFHVGPAHYFVFYQLSNVVHDALLGDTPVA